MDKHFTDVDLSKMPLTPPPPAAPTPVEQKPEPAAAAPTPKAPPPPSEIPEVVPDLPPNIPPMPKEPTQHNIFVPMLLVLILIGGLVTAGALFFLNKPTPKPIVQTKKQPTPTPGPLFLTLSSPTEEIQALNGEILIAGTTTPNTLVSVYSDSDDILLQSDTDGNFETTLLVGDTGSTIAVKAFSDRGEEKSVTLSVGGSVLGKSTEAPGQAKKNETDAVGGEADLSQADNGNGKKADDTVKETGKPETVTTRQAEKTVSKETETFLTAKKEAKEEKKLGILKLKEALQSGSPSATLGKLEKFKVTEASSEATLTRHAVMGIVTNIAQGAITIQHQNKPGETTVILYNANTVVTTVKTGAGGPTLKAGDRIAAVGVVSSDGLLANRIHIIPGLAKGLMERTSIGTASESGMQSSEEPVINDIPQGVLPTLSLETPTPSPTPTPAI